MVGAVAGRAVAVAVADVARQQSCQEVLEVGFRARADLDQCQTDRRVLGEHVEQTVAVPAAE